MTNDVQDLLERVAASLHESWREYNAARGRVFGPERTIQTHPHLVAWADLDTCSQNQDRFVAAVLLDQWSCGTLEEPAVPRAIHEAWRRWILLQGRTHPHAEPYEVAHAEGGEDHEAQALQVMPLLQLTRMSRK